jgi:hypothetical protein
VTRRENFEWPLNRAHLVLEPLAAPGEVRGHLDSNTPGLDTYLAARAGGTPQAVDAVFTGKLHAGANRLSVVPRNRAGREGSESWIEVEHSR